MLIICLPVLDVSFRLFVDIFSLQFFLIRYHELIRSFQQFDTEFNNM